MAIYPKTIMFVDGENLTLRYQAMVEEGRIARDTTLHGQDAYVWSPSVTQLSAWYLSRVSYYTSVVGDDVRIESLAKTLAGIQYHHSTGSGFLNPHIFKKQKRGQKTKSVDINLVTDLLRHTYNHSIELAVILSGDGDYLPTIREAMRQGIQVYIGAFSSGLDERLRI